MSSRASNLKTWAFRAAGTAGVAVVVLFAQKVFHRIQKAEAPQAESKIEATRPAKLSGVLNLNDQCPSGYYLVRLKGQSSGAQIQVETQSDPSGKFQLQAPPGEYALEVERGECGSSERVVLEENTEHMMAVGVQNSRPIDKEGKIRGRLPASVLVPMPTRVKAPVDDSGQSRTPGSLAPAAFE